MNFLNFISKINAWSNDKVPFLFIIDFEMEKPLAFTFDQINSRKIKFDIRGFSNAGSAELVSKNNIDIHIKEKPSEADYQQKYDTVMTGLKRGDSYLTNLTVKTKVNINRKLEDLFHFCKAPYKLYLKNEFLVYSPEPFIRIVNGEIFSYPMKGTIDASFPNAAAQLMNDKKEKAEHMTIVDLIRNDLSQVSKNVEVKRLRYIEEIVANNKKLLQTSSEICGLLDSHFQHNIGDLLAALLPAGSVSGAPKEKTLEIIKMAEKENRGYYTGVFGYFDGADLDSSVMIRCIEKSEDEYFYRSGGGITAQSKLMDEFNEVINKVYVPVN